MSVLGAIVLLFAGLAGVLAAGNAARPLIDPTRRYSPWWLPAMVVTELAPFWLALHAMTLAVGLALGGGSNWGGRLGAALLVVAMLLLVWVILRSLIGVRKLRRLVRGVVHPVGGAPELAGRRPRPPDGVVEVRGVTWRPGLTLDLVRPDDDRRDLGVCVYVHGGGWTGGDPRRQARDLYHTLALGGWATVAIRYPFAPDATVEEQIATVREAVRWVRTELPARGVDATAVVLAGGSAGGHLAAMAALTASGPEERVDACIGIYGIYDMANRNRLRAHWQMVPDRVMGTTVEEQPERYRAVSPIDQHLAESPPFLVVHGTHDTLVPVDEGVQFVDVLRRAGRPVDFVPVYGAQHAFDAVSGAASRTTAAVIRDWLARTVQ